MVMPGAPRTALLLAILLLLPACASARERRPVVAPEAGRTSPAAAGTAGATARAAATIGAISSAEVAYLLGRRLMVPVHGVGPEQLRDDFLAPRSGGRRHHALDIPAPRLTPVLAADDGYVLALRSNTLGGLIIYLVDEAERFVYYYAHLDSFREGLRPGERVRAGDVIGYVGTTGNADGTIPHLHLQIMRYQPRRYWEGVPVNPYPILQRRGEARPR